MSTTLAQQIQVLFDHSKVFSLSREEIDHRVSEWALTNDSAQVYALMRSVDPKRQVYLYPVSTEEDMHTKLTEVFEQARFFELSEDELRRSVSALISDGHDAVKLLEVMKTIDPERLVFTPSIMPAVKVRRFERKTSIDESPSP
ncbi:MULTISPECIES: hypothetical protein [Pseudomonas]|uniref:hypothetical protein n=1 Tax=Pseudomonas TaxID=286 RepID=UPI000F03B7E1|nr:MULTISPECIES: hypothetical protein [Pseudomonas]MBD8615641.1 hypothetical protein [Pseudomonas putida]MBD8681703.1 hypothetical protein [Pseudomonas sp. CFBP 13719]